MKDCLFCKIIKGEIPSKVVYKDDKIFAFHDINPQAPVHIIIISKKHIPRIADLTENDKEISGHLLCKIPEIIKQFNLEDQGVRLINNCNSQSGQSVFHLHFHLLGGRNFGWPPG